MVRPRHKSDEEILEAAREVFLDDPSASTTTIAERVGLSQAALFKRFRTKMNLFLCALGIQDGPPWVAIVRAGPDDRPIGDQLRDLAAEILVFFQVLMPRIHAMKAGGVDFAKMFGSDTTPPPVVALQALCGFFQRAIDRGLVRPGDPHTMASMFLTSLQGRVFWQVMAGDAYPHPIADDGAYIDQVVTLLLAGLAPDAPAEASP